MTIALWCMEKSMEGWVGDMGIIAIIPLLAFFGTGILSKVRRIVNMNWTDESRRTSIPSIGRSFSSLWVVSHLEKLPSRQVCLMI